MHSTLRILVTIFALLSSGLCQTLGAGDVGFSLDGGIEGYVSRVLYVLLG